MAIVGGKGVPVEDLYWLAGLIEGEGCFHKRRGRPTPIIQVMMTDKDVVIRAAEILGANRVRELKSKTSTGKTVYGVTVFGQRAVDWCHALHPIMGERRQQKITELLDALSKSKPTKYLRRNCSSRGGVSAWVNPNFENKAA